MVVGIVGDVVLIFSLGLLFLNFIMINCGWFSGSSRVGILWVFLFKFFLKLFFKIWGLIVLV